MNLPKFKYIDDNRVELIEDYILYDKRYIPKGFESDLGSIPFLFHWFLKPKDIKYSSIIHDFDWLMSDFDHYDYHRSNDFFLSNAIIMDNIPVWKAVISYLVLEIVIGMKFNKYY
jgi:hypothetical protein